MHVRSVVHFDMISEKSCRVTSRQLLSRMQETIKKMKVPECCTDTCKRNTQGVAGASVVKEKGCTEGGAVELRHDGVCLFLEQVSLEVQRARAAVPADRSLLQEWDSCPEGSDRHFS